MLGVSLAAAGRACYLVEGSTGSAELRLQKSQQADSVIVVPGPSWLVPQRCRAFVARGYVRSSHTKNWTWVSLASHTDKWILNHWTVKELLGDDFFNIKIIHLSSIFWSLSIEFMVLGGKKEEKSACSFFNNKKFWNNLWQLIYINIINKIYTTTMSI